MYAARLWQKEASDKSPKSEKVMFLDWTYSIIIIYTYIPSLEQKHSSCWKIFESRHHDIALIINVHDRHILLIYEKCDFQELLPFVRVRTYIKDPPPPPPSNMQIIITLKALFNHVSTVKNLSCMSLHAISVFDEV